MKRMSVSVLTTPVSAVPLTYIVIPWIFIARQPPLPIRPPQARLRRPPLRTTSARSLHHSVCTSDLCVPGDRGVLPRAARTASTSPWESGGASGGDHVERHTLITDRRRSGGQEEQEICPFEGKNTS